MKKYFLVALAVILTICVSACSNKKSTQAGESQAGAPATMQESTHQMTDVTGVQASAYNETDASVSEEAESGGEGLTEFVKPSNEEMQTALKNAGFYTGAIDGKIGALSEKAIKDFQQQNGLKVDGKVGRKTWSILKKYLSPEAQRD